jgi:hypothetical protein
MNITLVSEETNYNRDYGFWLLLKDDHGTTVKSARIVWEMSLDPRSAANKELVNFLLSLEAILERYGAKKIAEEKPSSQSDPNEALIEQFKEILKTHILVRKDDILNLLSHSPKFFGEKDS